LLRYSKAREAHDVHQEDVYDTNILDEYPKRA